MNKAYKAAHNTRHCGRSDEAIQGATRGAATSGLLRPPLPQ